MFSSQERHALMRGESLDVILLARAQETRSVEEQALRVANATNSKPRRTTASPAEKVRSARSLKGKPQRTNDGNRINSASGERPVPYRKSDKEYCDRTVTGQEIPVVRKDPIFPDMMRQSALTKVAAAMAQDTHWKGKQDTAPFLREVSKRAVKLLRSRRKRESRRVRRRSKYEDEAGK